MAKYNIYKLRKDRKAALLEKFDQVGLSLGKHKNVDGFNLSFYYSKQPEDIDIWWTELYNEYLDTDAIPKNKAYFAVFLIESNTLLYAVSVGKSHFYLKDFCDSDFGINLAQRIVDQGSLKLKNSKLFGSKKNKTITSYQENSEFEYDSGESIQYVKAKTIDKERWGEVASFGNSVQLHLEVHPDGLPGIVNMIEEELQKVAIIDLPRAIAVTDEDKTVLLDEKLAADIMNNSAADLQPAEATVSGVDFIFLDKSNYRFIFDNRRENVSGELTLEALRHFVNANDINLNTGINEIKVKVGDEHTSKYTKPLKYFLDYVDDERHFLLDGQWHLFNQNYIDYLNKQIDERITFEDPGINFSNAEFAMWKQQQPVHDRGKPNYAEYYFNLLRGNEGYFNRDRNISMLEQYQIEKMDLFKDETAFFVKIGTPQKLGYVIDQAAATIKVLQTRTSDIQIEGQIIKPKKICLWLILERETEITKITDIKSLIFLMKLADWQKQCSNARYEPIVRVGYRID